MDIKKKTKIVATISDRRCEVNFIRQLYESGMDVVRLNTAHQAIADSLKVINSVRQVSDKIPIIIDTKGPEIRTVKTEKIIEVKKEQEIKIIGDPSKESDNECIFVSYPEIHKDVSVNDQILIDDGAVELLVIGKKDNALLCKVMNEGVIKGKKSVNVPNAKVKLPALTEKDRDYVKFAIEQNIEFIAHSFVRSKEDLLEIQHILDQNNSKIKLIAKIENQEGVDNLDEILDYAYGIMVARGDLAIEIPYEKIPGIQKMIINKCIHRRKPVIVATQMLHSMIQNPRPTRAEVSDIANAIYSKTDAIMLSGETAFGEYPLESVQTMSRVAKEVEKSRGAIHNVEVVILNTDITAYLIKAAVESSIHLNCKAIIADSLTGRTIRELAAYRGKNPIFAFCYDKRTMLELTLFFGVYSEYMEPREYSHEFRQHSLESLIEKGEITEEDRVVILAGNFGKSNGASFIEISTVKNLRKI